MNKQRTTTNQFHLIAHFKIVFVQKKKNISFVLIWYWTLMVSVSWKQQFVSKRYRFMISIQKKKVKIVCKQKFSFSIDCHRSFENNFCLLLTDYHFNGTHYPLVWIDKNLLSIEFQFRWHWNWRSSRFEYFNCKFRHISFTNMLKQKTTMDKTKNN